MNELPPQKVGFYDEVIILEIDPFNMLFDVKWPVAPVEHWEVHCDNPDEY